MYGMPPIGECTAACGAGQPHLYAGMAYHAAAAERAAAELLAAEGGEKGKKRRRVRTKNKRKSGDGGGGEGGDGGDGGRTSPTILDSDHAAALDARPANHSNNNGNANTDAEDDTAVAVTSKTTPPTAPLLRTCFCATCLNPPTRLARLDDTDQEDN
ncbi:hypothetical protein Q8F55_008553 [Vanrija albida]|uniref:Uncharacterized protein n=1 Tax=Vanrija albida TaxID=181172 RepID=A0ABR3PRH1_9TREE